MDYKKLETILNGSETFENKNDEEILAYFASKYATVPFNDHYMFVFDHNREFKGKNHIVDIHKRNLGKVPMHIYHYIVITYVYSGTLTITIENETIQLNKGDLIIFDRHVPHSVNKTSSNDLGINIILNDTYFAKKFINQLPNDKLISKFLHELLNYKKNHTHYLLFNTQEDELTKNCIQNILCEYYEPIICSDELIDNFIMILITHLVRKFKYNTNLTVSMFKNQKLIDDILLYIHNHYQEGSLHKMCMDFGYDSSYTSKLIKQFSGQTFKQLVNNERMKSATILLHNHELPIYKVAEMIGLNNLTSFYKKFQEYANCTPQEYRDRYKDI